MKLSVTLNKTEIRRQILHMLTGLSIIYLIGNNIITVLHLFLILIFGSVLSLLTKLLKLKLVYRVLSLFDRERDIKRIPGKGAISFLIGCILALKLFPLDIAFASIMILSFGDAISHLVGIHFGRVKNPINHTKSLEGNVAGAIAGFIVSMPFVGPFNAFLASFGAMAVESVELKMNDEIVDDNIVVPLAAGTILYLISLYLQF